MGLADPAVRWFVPEWIAEWGRRPRPLDYLKLDSQLPLLRQMTGTHRLTGALTTDSHRYAFNVQTPGSMPPPLILLGSSVRHSYPAAAACGAHTPEVTKSYPQNCTSLTRLLKITTNGGLDGVFILVARPRYLIQIPK